MVLFFNSRMASANSASASWSAPKSSNVAARSNRVVASSINRSKVSASKSDSVGIESVSPATDRTRWIVVTVKYPSPASTTAPRINQPHGVDDRDDRTRRRRCHHRRFRPGSKTGSYSGSGSSTTGFTRGSPVTNSYRADGPSSITDPSTSLVAAVTRSPFSRTTVPAPNGDR